jgi:uncharacterized protein YjbI with pentapeptide repeats
MSMPIVLVVALAALALFVTLSYRRHWNWTGLPASPSTEDNARRGSPKTLWDWLQLLGIPVVLAALAFALSNAQTQRDRVAAIDAEREATLRGYLTQMSELMLTDKLTQSGARSAVRNVARTATLTAVRRLDGARRGLIVRFLFEAGLLGVLGRDGQHHTPARVDVASAELRASSLAGAELIGIDLSRTDLREANLGDAFVRDADLSHVNLRGSDLRGSDLRRSDLSDAELHGADLRGANLSDTNFREASLHGADLTGAYLYGADLTRTDLSGANLSGAALDGAKVDQANLDGALGANLTETRGTASRVP